jgi:hypothetical protein
MKLSTVKAIKFGAIAAVTFIILVHVFNFLEVTILYLLLKIRYNIDL